MKVRLTLLFLDTLILDNIACEPLVQLEIRSITDFGNLVLLHLVLCKPLLHTETQEILIVVT